MFDKNFHIHYIGVTDGKTTMWKKNGKTNTGHLIFYYTIHLDTVYMYIKFEEAGINRS